MREHSLILALVCAVLASQLAAVSAQDDVMTADELAIVRLCASESSIRVSDDCRVIAWIVRSGAERRGITPAAYVARYHHRHTRSTSRPWLGELDARLSMPPSWPDDRVPWATRGRPGMLRLLEVVRAEEGHGCDGRPATWAGTMDDDGLRRWQARGASVLACGRTVNRIVGWR